MAPETSVDSNFQMTAQSLAQTGLNGGLKGPSRSNNMPQKDEHYQGALAFLSNTSSRTLPNTSPMIARMNVDSFSGEMNLTAINKTMNSQSVSSSLAMDSKPELPKAPYLYRCPNSNTESYLDLPSSPPSFISHNLSSCSSVLDSSSIVQHNSQLDTNCLQARKRELQGEVAEEYNRSLLNSIKQEPCTSMQMHKKPRLDIQQEAIMHHYVLQQLLQKPDSEELQGHVPQLQSLFHQRQQIQKLNQNQNQNQNQKWQKILQSVTEYQEVDMQQRQQQQIRDELQQRQQQQIRHQLQQRQQQQIRQHLQQQQEQQMRHQLQRQQRQQMRHQLQQQVLRQVPAINPFNEGICSRRLMQQLYHLRQRPADNGISYWKKFISEYYAPCARRRWCFSLYDKNVGHHALGMTSQATQDAWQCDLCGCKSGRGFEVIYEVLPWLSKVTFDTVMDELLFLDLPREHRLPSGLMVLEYEKAVQESVYEKLRVVRDGHLRIIYTHDLKILCWEFCSWHHEELFPRTFLASQVDLLVHAERICKVTDGGSLARAVTPRNLKANCHVFLEAGNQLARTLDLQLVDDLGFSKSYTRCLQIGEIVYSTRDLMTSFQINNMEAMESLKRMWKEEAEEEGGGSAHFMPTDKDKLLAVATVPGSNVNNNLGESNGVYLTSSKQTAPLMWPGRYHKSLGPNSTSEAGEVKQHCYSPYASNQDVPYIPYQGPQTSSSGQIQNLPMDRLSSTHSLEVSQNNPDMAIQKPRPEVINSSRKVNGTAGDRAIRAVGKSTGLDQPTRVREIDISRRGLNSRDSTTPRAVLRNALGGMAGRGSSSGTVSHGKSSEFYANNFTRREPDLPEKLDRPVEFLNMIDDCHGSGELKWQQL